MKDSPQNTFSEVSKETIYIKPRRSKPKRARPCNITCFPQPHVHTQSFTAATLQHIRGGWRSCWGQWKPGCP